MNNANESALLSRYKYLMTSYACSKFGTATV